MKWRIPAKTFLVGEYAALGGESALLLTTTPYFELTLSDQEELINIHPASPAGIWWQQQNNLGKGLTWSDPYTIQGGLGASSAQFIACYLATCYLQNKTPQIEELLAAYYQCAWTGKGTKPSGYDVIAQYHQGCVFINKQQELINSYSWPFADLSFILLHTEKKLATHHHLQEFTSSSGFSQLGKIADLAKQAFESSDSQLLITVVNSYHEQLRELNLVAEHTLAFIEQLKTYPEILAMKGCGALGADVLFLITYRTNVDSLSQQLINNSWRLLATEKQLTPLPPQIASI